MSTRHSLRFALPFASRLVAASAVAAILGLAPRASACSAPICVDSVIAPLGTTAEPATLPAGSAFVRVVRPGVGSTDPVMLSIERTRAGSTTTTTVSAVDGIAPLEDAEEGDVFVVTESHECTGGAPSSVSTTIEIGAPAEPPTALGTLSVAAPARTSVTVSDVSGPCTSSIDSVAASYEVTLDGSATPWGDAIEQQAFVDGVAWYEPTWTTGSGPSGSSYRFVFAACATPTTGQAFFDLDEGTHTLRVDGHVRGTDTTVSTSEVSFTLSCGTGGDAGAVDAGATGDDGGASAVDAGTTSDAGSPSSSGGGGCAVTRGRSDASRSFAVLALLVGLAMFSRRRPEI